MLTNFDFKEYFSKKSNILKIKKIGGKYVGKIFQL